MSNWKRWGRGAIVAAAMGGVVLASSGCVSLDTVFAGQTNGVGDILIAGTACQSGSAGCSGTDILNGDLAGSAGTGQLLVGYRVPASATPPATVNGDTASVTFTASPTYAAELERLSPAGPGRKWAGYISSTMDVGAADKDIDLTAPFSLGQGADGSPFAGPFAYRMVVGGRVIDETHPADAPVVCGATVGALNIDSATICVDSPLIATIDGPDATLNTRDLGILTGANGSGQAGTTITVPFTAKFAGAPSGANFALSASTTLPGGTVVVTPGSLPPAADSTNPVSVAVAVPAGTAPGNYDVTLTAKLGSQTRVRTGTLTVTAPPVVTPPVVTPPVVTPAALKLTGTLPGRLAFLTARGKGLKVVVRANRSGRAVVRLVQGGKALVAKTVTLRNGSTTVVLKSRKVVAGAYRVTVTFTATGKVTTLRGTLRAR